MKNDIKISPSILSADFSKLGEEIKLLEKENEMQNEGTNITRYDDAADIFAREGLPKLVLNEIKPNEIKAGQETANINNKELPIKFKESKSANNNQVLNTMQELDKKANEARVKFSKAFDLNKDFNKIIENRFHNISLSILTGPTFADEVAKKKPAAAIVANKEIDVATSICKLFHNSNLRLYQILIVNLPIEIQHLRAQNF